MNNIQELVKRLETSPRRRDSHKGDTAALIDIDDLHAAITALKSMQAPLPEDVEQLTKELFNRDVPSNTLRQDIADLLERLAYENQCHILARKEDKQRIEELEGQLTYIEEELMSANIIIEDLKNEQS
jgi:chromosome segregation ATPase